MHYTSDVQKLINQSSEPVLQRFALDCAERAMRAAQRTGHLPDDYAEVLRGKLSLKRQHLTQGTPDREAMMALLAAHFVERDARPKSDGLGFDGAVCWALDVESSVAEATREAASDASTGVGWDVRRAGCHRNQAFFWSDNEDLWQARRLTWLGSRLESILFHLDEADAAPETRLDFNPEAALEAMLAQQRALPVEERVPVLAEIQGMLDDDCWAVILVEPAVVTIAHSPKRQGEPSVVELRVRDENVPAPFDVLDVARDVAGA